MKKIFNTSLALLFAMLLLIPSVAMGGENYRDTEGSNSRMQLNKMEQIIKKYSDSKFVETVEISPMLLKGLSKAKNTDEIVKDLTGLRIISFEREGAERTAVCNKFMGEVKDALKVGYSKLVDVKSDGDKVTIFVDDASSQLIMFIDNIENFTLITLDGTITKSIISSVMNGDIKFK